MKVLVLGSGGREHALAWKFSKSRLISGLYVAPGNAGTEEIAENLVGLNALDCDAVVATCRDKKIDVVFVGPEEPLAAGLVDRLNEEKIPAFGPHAQAAMLESSKAFAKKFMASHGIPTAQSREFASFPEFEAHMKTRRTRAVVKKSGLAAGKGVLDSDNRDEQLKFGRSVLKTDRLVVEDYLSGTELSLFALCDGVDHLLLPVAADFKKAHDNDLGKNTGGMGAVCPVPSVEARVLEGITREIVEPTFKGLAEQGLAYRGVLYFGLMQTADGPRLLEYNVRFGDPETQVLLPLIESDFGNLVEAVVQGRLKDFPLHLSNNSALGVVVASKGYPDSYKTGIPVRSLPTPHESEGMVFHAGTRLGGDGQIVTAGGRCFTVVGIGPNLLTADMRAYDAVSKVQFDGAWSRKDIGKKFFID